jgi:hypothetical protein
MVTKVSARCASGRPRRSPGSSRPAGLSDPIKNKLTHINMNTDQPNRHTTRMLR